MSNLISSIVIEDLAIELDNEIRQFLLSHKEVACYLSPSSVTLIAIGPNAVILITELKKQISKLLDKPIEKVLFTKQNEPVWYNFFLHDNNMAALNN